MSAIARTLFEHRYAQYQFGPDRWMTVQCECGAVTAADNYLAANAHVAAVEVHARHQAEILGDPPKDAEAWNRAIRVRASDEAIRDRPYEQRSWLRYFRRFPRG